MYIYKINVVKFGCACRARVEELTQCNKDVLHVLFRTNLKPNDSDVEHSSHVKHSCFLFAKHWRARNTVFDVRDSCCQRTALM